MKKRCPVCDSENTSAMYPFASLYCSDCKYDEDYHNIEEYKTKIKNNKTEFNIKIDWENNDLNINGTTRNLKNFNIKCYNKDGCLCLESNPIDLYKSKILCGGEYKVLDSLLSFEFMNYINSAFGNESYSSFKDKLIKKLDDEYIELQKKRFEVERKSTKLSFNEMWYLIGRQEETLMIKEMIKEIKYE